MNEKIKELAEQAGVEYTITKVMFLTGEEEIQKFAELIVKECIEQVELVRKYRYDRVQPLENQQTIISECQYQIKEHFGVEL